MATAMKPMAKCDRGIIDSIVSAPSMMPKTGPISSPARMLPVRVGRRARRASHPPAAPAATMKPKSKSGLISLEKGIFCR